MDESKVGKVLQTTRSVLWTLVPLTLICGMLYLVNTLSPVNPKNTVHASLDTDFSCFMKYLGPVWKYRIYSSRVEILIQENMEKCLNKFPLKDVRGEKILDLAEEKPYPFSSLNEKPSVVTSSISGNIGCTVYMFSGAPHIYEISFYRIDGEFQEKFNKDVSACIKRLGKL